jgi:septal ring-binding cell division protein DamX
VRRIGDLREQLHNTRGQASMPIVNPPSVYTLQVFASSSSENVDRLVARYPALALRVHVSEGEATPYRVLYGSFDSTREAEDAAAELPAAMLKEVGKPLVRESADFP